MGEKVTTVKSWLQKERGPKKPPFKSKVTELLQAGLAADEIVEAVGCTHENIRKIEREIRPTLPVSYLEGMKKVERFVADPDQERQEQYTHTILFGRNLLGHCNRETTANPKNAKPLIDIAISHFSHLRSAVRSRERVKAATCNFVQASATNAARERALDRPEEGLRILQGLKAEYAGCDSCAADLARRESMMLKDLKQYDKSLKRIQESKRIYRALGHDGHDAFSNGLGSCVAFESLLLYYMGRSDLALLTVDTALEEGVVMRYNECNPTPSALHLRIAWLSGRAAERSGNCDLARNRYEDAYDDALELGLRSGVGALVADIERVTSNPKSLHARIDRLSAWSEMNEWIRPTVQVLAEALAAHGKKKDVLDCIRVKSGGNKFLPLDAAMAAA